MVVVVVVVVIVGGGGRGVELIEGKKNKVIKLLNLCVFYTIININ